MLSKKERRFVRTWEEQRKGSKAGYYALYIFIWFFVAMLGLFFVFVNITDVYRNTLATLYQMIAIALFVAAITTHFVYQFNEKRFKKIIRREINEAKE